jgi:hypothetical protein
LSEFALGRVLDIFELDRSLIDRYAKFARSFSIIQAPEIRKQIDWAYDQHRFWPPPLITINPRYEEGASIDRLVSDQILDSELRRIFAMGDRSNCTFRLCRMRLCDARIRF